MKVYFKRHAKAEDMIEMWGKIGSKPYLMAVIHEDFFTLEAIQDDELQDGVLVELKVRHDMVNDVFENL